MNVYDFDGTIYKDDSTRDFYNYIIKKKPQVLFYFPGFVISYIKYRLKFINKTKLKEVFFQYLNCLGEGEVEKYVSDFWDTHRYKIYDWYKKQKESSDIIISASPRYILDPICKELGVHRLICSEVDKNTGDYEGLNCHGEEKVNRFYKEFPDGKIDKFYSDSKSDLPLAKIAKEAFLVKKGGKLKHWIME